MDASVGKRKRINNESNRKRQNSELHLDKELYDLPLEILDIILQKSYLYWILSSSTKQRDEEVIRSLVSVDVCFNQRITRQRFKRTIWRNLKDFYAKAKKRSAIIRNNGNYLLETFQPNDELICSLLSLNCITEEQSHFIQRQRSNRDKNAELLHAIKSFDDTNFSNLVRYLRKTNHHTVARIIENGGVVIKVKVKSCGTTCPTSMDPKLLHRGISDFRNRTKPISHRTDKLISQLKDEGIEILSSHLDRQTVNVWIWCRSQEALQHIQQLNDSHQLIDVFLGFANIRPRASETNQSKVINIDCNQFKKNVVVCPTSLKFTERIDVGRNETVHGVTKLRNEIYVICQPFATNTETLIYVFEDRNSFRLQAKMEAKEIEHPIDIVSTEKKNCLYVSDYANKCVWKVTRETVDQLKIIKWLTIDYLPHAMSVSSDGNLLVVDESSFDLLIYGSDAELLRSVELQSDLLYPYHVVETTTGNFIISHGWIGQWESTWMVSEASRDGQMVIRRFISSDQTQKLCHPHYLSLDLDDQVYIADFFNGRVILLDSDLKWNRILCPTNELKETKNQFPQRLYFDLKKKQLLVGDFSATRQGVNVYTLS